MFRIARDYAHATRVAENTRAYDVIASPNAVLDRRTADAVTGPYRFVDRKTLKFSGLVDQHHDPYQPHNPAKAKQQAKQQAKARDKAVAADIKRIRTAKERFIAECWAKVQAE